MPLLSNFSGGSPPHTRGTLYAVGLIPRFCGITPAYAGNTLYYSFTNSIFWDHPRIRGEHRLASLILKMMRGSPPHTRGTPNVLANVSFTVRITPAYAGNTSCTYIFRLYSRDHPRIRGEHKQATDEKEQAIGSPPHTRGTR